MSHYSSKRYAIYEWDDETSASDPRGVWMGGSEYYSRTYRCWVPKGMLAKAEKTGNFDALDDWIAARADEPGIWDVWPKVQAARGPRMRVPAKRPSIDDEDIMREGA